MMVLGALAVCANASFYYNILFALLSSGKGVKFAPNLFLKFVQIYLLIFAQKNGIVLLKVRDMEIRRVEEVSAGSRQQQKQREQQQQQQKKQEQQKKENDFQLLLDTEIHKFDERG